MSGFHRSGYILLLTFDVTIYVTEFGKPSIYAQQYFCNKTHLKTMGKKCKLQKKNYASFYHLAGERRKPPMDKSWASSCSPVHREYKNLCRFHLHTRKDSKVTDVCLRCGDERIYRHSFFSEFAFLLEQRSTPGGNLYLDGCTKSWRTQ